YLTPHGSARGLVSGSSGTHIPAEVAALRDVAKRVLEGQTLRALCADLANRGVTRAEGQPWDPNLLLRTLLNPYVGGYRSHLGEVVAKGTWKPLLRASVWHAVRVELEGGGRVNHGQSGHLLSGIIEC